MHAFFEHAEVSLHIPRLTAAARTGHGTDLDADDDHSAHCSVDDDGGDVADAPAAADSAPDLPSEDVAAMRRLGLLGDFFGAIVSPFKAAAHSLSDIVHGAEDLWEVGKGLVTGDFGGECDAVDGVGYNYNFASGSPDGPVSMGDHINCKTCFFMAEVSLDASFTVQDHTLQRAAMVLTGTALAELEAALTYDEAYNAASNHSLATIHLPTISLDLAGFPLVLHTSVPITYGWDLTVQVECAASASVKAGGDIQFGYKYTPAAGLHYVSNHTWQHTGGLQSTTPTVSLGGHVYINPQVVLNIDGLGGPSLSVKPYLEVLVTGEDGNQCAGTSSPEASPQLHTSKTRPASIRGAATSDAAGAGGALVLPSPDTQAPDAVVVQIAVNWGIQATIMAFLQLEIAGDVLWHHSFAPWTVFSVKRPVMSGCYNLGSTTMQGRVATGTPTRLRGNGNANTASSRLVTPLLHADAVQATSGTELLVGQVWSGFQHMFPNPPPACGNRSHLFSTGLSMQLLAHNPDGTYTFFGSAYNIETSDGSRCMIESLYTVTIYNDLTAQFTPTVSGGTDDDSPADDDSPPPGTDDDYGEGAVPSRSPWGTPTGVDALGAAGESGVEDLYYSCSNPDTPIAEHPFPAQFSSDYSVITSGCTPGPDNCGCISLSRVNSG